MDILARLQSDTLLAASPNPYVVLDAQGTIVWVNDAQVRATALERDRQVGRKWYEAFPSPRASSGNRQMTESLARVIATGERDDIPLLRYNRTEPDGSISIRYWSMAHTPLKDATGQVTHILCNPIELTELHRLRTLHQRASLLQRARVFSAELEQARAVLEQAPGFVAVFAGRRHRFELASAACRTFWGRGELVGRTLAEMLPPSVTAEVLAVLDKVRATGTPFVGRRVAVQWLTGAQDKDHERYIDCVFQPIVDADGKVIAIYGQAFDVSHLVWAEEQRELLVSELGHRIRNTMSVIQGLAFQSFGQVNGGKAYADFARRLAALGLAHSLLTDGKWEAADARQAILTAVQAAAGEAAQRCEVRGPDVELSPPVTVSLSMIIHELATNAIKYGALSCPAGRVEIDLSADLAAEEPTMKLVWRERGGPPVRSPAREGFGTRLIGRGLANHSQASAELTFAPEGVVCTIVAGLR